ncbi:MAG: hypothetical protein AB7S38_40670 [Vulcanimicrobiota bacterium]
MSGLLSWADSSTDKAGEAKATGSTTPSTAGRRAEMLKELQEFTKKAIEEMPADDSPYRSRN